MKLDYNRNALDIFRLIATVQVFLGHMISHFTMENAPWDAVYFVRGVPILFVLCGFLAAKSLEGKSVKEWLWGRAVRILPAFWTVILVNSIIILLLYETKPTLFEGALYGFTQFFGLNFYTGDWLRGYGSGVPNGVLWTIPVQIQFFVLVPLLARFFKKKSLTVGAFFILLLTAMSVAMEKASVLLPEIAYKLLGVTVLPYLYFLCLGMLFWYHRERLIPLAERAKWLLLFGYIGWKLCEILLSFPHVFDGVLYNTVTTLLMAGVIFAFSFTGKWRMKNDLSYGFYLYHMVFINLALHFGIVSLEPLWLGALLTAGIAALTLGSALLSQKIVEQPAVKLLKKRG